MSERDVQPTATTMSPIGGLIEVGGLAIDEIAVFGDDSLRLAANKNGYPAVPATSEVIKSRWVAEATSAGMFEVFGTWFEGDALAQGAVAAGASANYLMLTDNYIRGAVPPLGAASVQTNSGKSGVSAGYVYLSAIPLVEVARIDGNKGGVAVDAGTEGIGARWMRSCDASWTKSGSLNPWHRENIPFAQAVLAAVIDAKLTHPDEKVRESAVQAQNVDRSRAFASRGHTTFQFAAPASPGSID